MCRWQILFGKYKYIYIVKKINVSYSEGSTHLWFLLVFIFKSYMLLQIFKMLYHAHYLRKYNVIGIDFINHKLRYVEI